MGCFYFFKNISPIKRKFGTCSKDCYCSCAFTGEWNYNKPEKKFIKAFPSKNHPFTRGFFCSKLNKRQDLIYHPARLKKPLLRNGEKGLNNFSAISLEKALDIIANKVVNFKNQYGSSSILATFNAGNYGLISRYAPLRFFGKLGAQITTGGICNEGGCAGLTGLFGTYSTTNPLQLINPATKLIVVWGSDLSNRNLHAYFLIKQAIKKGTLLVVIDSRLTDIAKKADHFIYTKPGTDHLLAHIIVKKLIIQKGYNSIFLEKHVDGYEYIINEAKKINYDRNLSLLEIDENQINEIIDLLIKFRNHTIFNVGCGVQKDYFGGKILQSIALIQILLGNFGKPGTGLIYSQSAFNRVFVGPLLDYITQFPFNSLNFNVNLIDLGSKLSSNEIKMVFIYNFNPASSLPNQNNLRKALKRKDLFIVVQEIFLNETTKYADIVIPSKFDLETNDLITPYYIAGLSINQAGSCPYPNCTSNFELFQLLAQKIDWINDPIFFENDESIVQNCLKLLPLKIQNDIKNLGYHLLFDPDDIPFQDLIFPTSNGRIQLENYQFFFGLDELEQRLNREVNEFLLITPSFKQYIHSQLGQINPKYLEVFEKVYLTQNDINKSNFKRGEKVIVSNEFGNGVFIVEESQSLKSGVVMIFSGCPLSSTNRTNVNILITDRSEELGFSGSYNSAVVKISKIKSKKN
ncbi:MAG: molybdopterin-dependent oxidoreductase [Candidatus Hodarchaeota archaeon]